MSRSVPNINRVAVVVEPKEPYLLWARNLDGDAPPMDSMSREDLTSVYLIEYNDDLERPLMNRATVEDLGDNVELKFPVATEEDAIICKLE